MPNETVNKIVVMLFVLLVIIVLYPAFKRIRREVIQMIKDSKGIKIR